MARGRNTQRNAKGKTDGHGGGRYDGKLGRRDDTGNVISTLYDGWMHGVVLIHCDSSNKCVRIAVGFRSATALIVMVVNHQAFK